MPVQPKAATGESVSQELRQERTLVASLWRANEETALSLEAIEMTAQTSCDGNVIAGIARAAIERVEANAATILQLAARFEALNKAGHPEAEGSQIEAMPTRH